MGKVADGFYEIAQAVYDIAEQAAADPGFLRADATAVSKQMYTAIYGKEPKGMAAIQQLYDFLAGWDDRRKASQFTFNASAGSTEPGKDQA